MKITAYRPRPDISENSEERIDIELTDEVILLIGKRYFELIYTVQPETSDAWHTGRPRKDVVQGRWSGDRSAVPRL